jgi:hypothetical protein
MQFKIQAKRDGHKIDFYVDAKSAAEALSYWQGHTMSQGCTDGICETNAMPQRTEKRSWPTEFSFIGTTCPECGMTTTRVKDGTYVAGQENFCVHRAGCSKIKSGDFALGKET